MARRCGGPALRAVTQDWMARSRQALERHFDATTARELDALIVGLVLHSALSTDPMTPRADPPRHPPIPALIPSPACAGNAVAASRACTLPGFPTKGHLHVRTNAAADPNRERPVSSDYPDGGRRGDVCAGRRAWHVIAGTLRHDVLSVVGRPF
ncbi:hypothetical protein [Nonomuraea sp. CA-141351]|uniref:hypothetical protein n=1 Tax=Nonomuraea sp. CA-141351 TaxID=3239996 RepID=UPI003D8B6CDE